MGVFDSLTKAHHDEQRGQLEVISLRLLAAREHPIVLGAFGFSRTRDYVAPNWPEVCPLFQFGVGDYSTALLLAIESFVEFRDVNSNGVLDADDTVIGSPLLARRMHFSSMCVNTRADSAYRMASCSSLPGPGRGGFAVALLVEHPTTIGRDAAGLLLFPQSLAIRLLLSDFPFHRPDSLLALRVTIIAASASPKLAKGSLRIEQDDTSIRSVVAMTDGDSTTAEVRWAARATCTDTPRANNISIRVSPLKRVPELVSRPTLLGLDNERTADSVGRSTVSHMLGMDKSPAPAFAIGHVMIVPQRACLRQIEWALQIGVAMPPQLSANSSAHVFGTGGRMEMEELGGPAHDPKHALLSSLLLLFTLTLLSVGQIYAVAGRIQQSLM